MYQILTTNGKYEIGGIMKDELTEKEKDIIHDALYVWTRGFYRSAESGDNDYYFCQQKKADEIRKKIKRGKYEK